MIENRNPLAQAFTLSSLLKFAFPSIIMMIFMGLYTLVDTIFISRFVNTDALSAVNIVCPVINVMVGLSAMIATGGNAIIARKMGQQEYERANKDFTLLSIAGFLIGVLFSIIGILFLDDLIYALGASERLYPYCKDYLYIILLFAPANMLQGIFQNLMITAGKPKLGLLLSIGAGLFNIILDYICMVPFDMGIRGAAIGTGLGYMMAAGIGMLFFISKKGSLTFKKPIFDMHVLLETCTNGCSEMVSQISTAVTTLLFNYVMMRMLGEKGVAAITILIYSQFMFTTLFIGFSIGVAPIISYNYGAENIKQLQKTMQHCIVFISIMSILLWLVSLWGGSTLVHIFTPRGTEVYNITYNGLRIFMYSFLLCGFNIFSSAMFTALSNGKVSALISFLRTFLFIFLFLSLLPKVWGVEGVWLAVPCAEVCSIIVTIYFVWKYQDIYHYI